MAKQVINFNKFNEYIINKYGQTLYEYFFKGYTEKFLKISSNSVHANWAKTGIERSIIDKKIKGNSLFELIKSILMPIPIKTKFIYPNQLGFGYFSDRLAAYIKKKGEILTSTLIKKIGYDQSTVYLNNKNFQYKNLIWSGNLLDLIELLDEKKLNLNYLSTIFYNCIIKDNIKRNDQWIYYADKQLNIVRTSIEKNFASYLTPQNYTSIVVEKTCNYKDDIWNNPDKLKDIICQELIQVKLIDSINQIAKIYIEPIRDTYPIYHLDYERNLMELSSIINNKYHNIKLLGRTGTFWYNNCDHSIAQALNMAKHF
ncbi:MAG: Amine oxidase [uncultured bacterium]|nr:MAG: Amine oxidase [uncultured bacterium]